MGPTRAEVAGAQENSLTKMKISFLLSNDLDIQETTDHAKIVDQTDSPGTFQQPQDTSIMAPQSFGSNVQFDRIERWVVSQSSTHIIGSASTYVADNEDCWKKSRQQWSQTKFTDHAPVISPTSLPTSPEYGDLGTKQIVLADTALIPPTSFTFRDSKRCGPPRVSYTRDEKLFIMHARVIGSMSWQDISMLFEKIFGEKDTKHTISGLRSTYYRIRRDWGMDCVTRSGPSQQQHDERVVTLKLREHAARACSSGFVV